MPDGHSPSDSHSHSHALPSACHRGQRPDYDPWSGSCATSSSDTSYLASLGSCLRWDEHRGEAYLALPSFPGLRLVAMRDGIEDDMVEHFNDRWVVGSWLHRIPYPFPSSNSGKMISAATQNPVHQRTIRLLTVRACHARLSCLSCSFPTTSASPTPTSRPATDLNLKGLPVDTNPVIPPPSLLECRAFHFPGNVDYLDFPFTCLFDTVRNKLVGEVGFVPHRYDHATADEVKAWPRSEQVWDLHYNVYKEYRERGIMTEAVGVMVESWIKPFMRIGGVGAITEGDSPASASQAVKRENGLPVITAREFWLGPEEKGAGIRVTGR